MGVLDDAIRDHLELKRRHGAEPGEVAHLERRALGPDGDVLADVLREDASGDGADAATSAAGLYGEPQSPREAAAMPAPTGEHAAMGKMPAPEQREHRSGFVADAEVRGATSEETIEIDMSSLTAGDGGGAAAGDLSDDRQR